MKMATLPAGGAIALAFVSSAVALIAAMICLFSGVAIFTAILIYIASSIGAFGALLLISCMNRSPRKASALEIHRHLEKFPFVSKASSKTSLHNGRIPEKCIFLGALMQRIVR
ncbi:hypothetical protein [Paracoccus sp. (in: a-proteobacteria)]|uniref:hypothetical protein n=1 Tax=Paracoccus sp. TaxID=267 RepID=UPI0028ABB1A6|nr:hypothetical protein [Paracoccus sp. (in: a-proteobacteria)]